MTHPPPSRDTPGHARRRAARVTVAAVALLLLAEPAYDTYAAGDLPLVVGEPIYSAAQLDDGWQLTGASGRRWILRDALSWPVVSPDGRKLAYDSDGRAGPVIHDLATGEVTDTPYPLSSKDLLSAGFSIDGRYRAAFTGDETIVLDIRPDGTVVRRLPYEPYGETVASADGRTLVVHGAHKGVELVDLDTGKVRKRLPVMGMEDLVGWKDPDTVLVATADGRAELDLTNGALTPAGKSS
ncbi:hypothetical protein ACIBG8_20585 [Nonomuraea sp. NPDC050556]|uniref:hypothetical protein n=1 Tax=Nonomuraea sp. NPDC050556 TaxID=3364369 RepID=UPI0037A21C2F